jgi:ligand-binding SRPBCC domain-containing protein
MEVYKKEWNQFMPRPLDEVWEFFSRPKNLKEVTQKDLNFELLSDIPNQLLGIKMR